MRLRRSLPGWMRSILGKNAPVANQALLVAVVPFGKGRFPGCQRARWQTWSRHLGSWLGRGDPGDGEFDALGTRQAGDNATRGRTELRDLENSILITL